MLNRFRWWLTRLICPKTIKVRFRIGSETKRSFAAVRIFYDSQLPGWMAEFDCYRPRVDTVKNQAIDIMQQREMEKMGQTKATKGEFPRKVDADILHEALKGTPLEGMDEKPE